MKKQLNHIFAYILLVFLLGVFSVPVYAEAASQAKTPTAEKYQVNGISSFSFSSSDKISDKFSYGQTSLGKLLIGGELQDAEDYEGVTAYETKGEVTFEYSYFNTFHSGITTNWNIADAVFDTKKVNIIGSEIKAESVINQGAVIIQKSSDGSNWENVTSVSDYFKENEADKGILHTVTQDELKQGQFFRVIVVYSMKKCTKDNPWYKLDEYAERSCAEVYSFFLCSGERDVIIRNLASRNSLPSMATVSDGFYIDTNGSSATVKVQKNNGNKNEVVNKATFTEPGKYTISTKSKLGKEFEYVVTISSGVTTNELTPVTYDCGDNKGYKIENSIPTSAECCVGPHLKVFVGQNGDTDIVNTTRINGTASYGVYGSSAEIYVSLNELKSDWEISYDSWGKKEKETVSGLVTGEVGTGALIIQKSIDGKGWVRIDSNKYANGLYTTDFEANYGTGGKILAYVPDGQDIISGEYYRILYAYEVKHGKTTKNYLEEYTFYLCNASTEAVTFHNKSIKDTLNEQLASVDGSTADIYRSAENMVSGSLTTTGFSIDKSLNLAARVYVKKNGTSMGYNVSDISETGKYEITVTSAVGNSETTILYVDTDAEEEIYSRYFGDSFIDGVRIYSEGTYPMFEGGSRTRYHLEAVGEEYLPLYGTITNKTTKSQITIAGTRSAKEGILEEPGEYEAVFYTNPTFATDEKSGDNRVITIKFTVIAEGNAPGPVINKQRLYDVYARSTVSDAYPIFYGLTYQSALKGTITLAFASEEAAEDYAYNYEKGDAEELADGSFAYKGTPTYKDGEYQYTGSFVKQKENFENGWTLADAIHNYAKQSVQKSYFDYGSMYSLSQKVIDETANLRQLELSNSIVIFADNAQKSVLTDLEDAIPFICNKPYDYAVSGNNKPESGYDYFVFTKDIYGSDSDSVVITDKNGKEYVIEYNKSVGDQLERANCPSGLVAIVETTKFGQKCEPYYAVYIAKGDNTGKVTIEYTLNGKINEIVYSQSDRSTEISCDSFRLSDVSDELDPYGVITVTGPNGIFFAAENEVIDDAWVLAGKYTISYKNRLGYSFSFTINVNENDNGLISFDGAGSEKLSDIATSYGDKNISLPKATRYGYDFAGYVDSEGNVYTDEISSVLFKGELLLNTTWKPKTFTLTTIVNDKKETYDISYGKQIDLPIPDLPSDYEFVTWILNGKEYAEECYTLTTEENVVLEAKTVKKANNTSQEISGSVVDTEDEETNANELESHWGVICIVVAIAIALGLFAFFFVSKKGIDLFGKNREE